MLDEKEVLAIVQQKFPGCNWASDKLETAVETFAIATTISTRPKNHPSPGWPVAIEVLYWPKCNAAGVFVSIGSNTQKLYLFVSPNRNDVTLDEALAQLKQWFVDFSECLSEVVK